LLRHPVTVQDATKGLGATRALFFCPPASGLEKRFVDRREKRAQELRGPQESLREIRTLQRGLVPLVAELAIHGFILGGERIEVRQRQALLAAVQADGQDAVAAFLALLLRRGSAGELLDAAVDRAAQRQQRQRRSALGGDGVADGEVRFLEH